MSFENVRITDRASGVDLRELVFPNRVAGTTSTVVQLRITNVSASPTVTLTSLRLAVHLLTGLFTGGTNEQGQEVVTSKWIEARVGAGAYQAIGGVYGNGAPAANYLALADLAPGAVVDVDVRVTVPAALTTARVARVRLGVSYRPV